MSGRWMVLVLAAGVLLAAATGCVPKDQYDKARAAAMMAQEELTRVNGELQQVRQQNQALQSEIADREAQLAANRKLMDNLNLANADWGRRYNELNDLYKKQAGRPIDLGPGPTVVLPPKLDAALRKLAAENPDIMEYLPEYGMVKLKADLTFEPGMTDIKPEAMAAMKKLAEILNTQDAQAFNIYAAGHTDDMPLSKGPTIEKHGSNWGLSAHRALAVVKALFESGVEQSRMAALGFSMYHPVAANAPGRKGNPANRRVELWIVPPGKFLTLSKEPPPAPAPAE